MLAKSDGKSYHSLLSQISFRTRISNHFKFPQIFFLERVSNPLLPANKQWIEDPRLASERTSPQRLIDGASPPKATPWNSGLEDDTLKDTKVTEGYTYSSPTTRWNLHAWYETTELSTRKKTQNRQASPLHVDSCLLR